MYRDTVDASFGNAALNLVDRRARQAIFWRRRALVAAMILLLGVGAFGLPISQTSGVLLAGGHAGALVYRYTNPVLAESFPDPDVVLDGGTYYAYSTNAAGRNVPIASSRDLVSWQIIGDALPQRPSWASTKADAIWAPAVAHAGRSWLLFVTAPDRISGLQCIGAAVAEHPVGPFRPLGSPLVCQRDQGGSMDPTVFENDNHAWLIWKNNGNCCKLDSAIWAQELGKGLESLRGSRVRLLHVDRAWQRSSKPMGTTIERLSMVHVGAVYYLFYSGNGYESAHYAIGYAKCNSPLGPCTEANGRPLVSSAGSVAGPGGPAVFSDRSGNYWLAYAAWDSSAVGDSSRGVRSLRLDPLQFNNGAVGFDGPSDRPRTLISRSDPERSTNGSGTFMFCVSSNLQPAWAVQAAAKVPTDPALSEQVRPRSPIALQGRVFGVRPAFVSGAV